MTVFHGKKKKVRVNLDLSEEMVQRLDKLQVRLEAQSRSAVVRQALILYEWFLSNTDRGNKVFIGVDREGSREQQLFSLR
jgi:metal-responsive CopG/Arc/MetJ family transcriptional regulator